MQTRKIVPALLAAGMIMATLCGANLLSSADTEAASTLLTRESAELFLPSSYEEYLPLKTPSSMAMNDDYIAVADGKLLYLYDREAEQYNVYEHTKTPNDIAKLQFTDSGRLFYSAGSALLEFEFETGEEKFCNNVPASAFLIEGNYLYTAEVASEYWTVTFYYAFIDETLEREDLHVLGTFTNASDPKFTCADDVLYCFINNSTCISYDMNTYADMGEKDRTLDGSTRPVSGLNYIAVLDGYFYYTVNNLRDIEEYPNGLYRVPLSGEAAGEHIPVLAGDAFSALTVWAGDLYCVKGASVHKLAIDEDGVRFDRYEIASASDSVGRLRDAGEIVRAGNLVVAAEGKRITVYDAKSGTYEVIDCPTSPARIATDGTNIAVSSGTSIYVYAKQGAEWSELYTNSVHTDVKGLTFVYGACYFVTQIGYGRTNPEADTLTPYEFTSSSTTSSLVSDLYGRLYVSFADGSVLRYTEEQFAAANARGEKLAFALPAGAASLRADFKGNLYCLVNSTIYRNGTALSTVNAADYIWLSADASVPEPASFALGFEDNEIYFCFGDFLVKTKRGAVKFPTLSELPAGDSSERVFTEHNEENLFVDVPERSVGVLFDLSELKTENEYFGYRGYYRTEEAHRGVLLTREGEYSLVVLCGEDNSYTASLFRLEDITVDEDEYWNPLSEEGARANYWGTDGETYLASEFSAYYFPCLMPDLAREKLQRGLTARVIGVVNAPEREYALIEYGTARTFSRAYVPVNLLSEVDPYPPAADAYFLGWLKASEKGVIFTDRYGNKVTVTERTLMRFYQGEDGTYTARFTGDGTLGAEGVEYSAEVTENMFERGESDAWRISLIIALSVLALVIIGAYVFLLPRGKNNTNS